MFLPSLSGRYAVGVTTFVTPIRPPRTIGSVKLKRPQNGRQSDSDHALVLEEVAFTAYYPAEVGPKSRKGVPWFPRPIKDSLTGFAAYLGISTWLLWPIVYLFGAFIKIPTYPNAPLLEPSKSDEATDQEGSRRQWPLVIFSHGLGGSRTAYSHFCSRVAASGRVVLAVEHRDGTGMFVTPRCWNHDGRSEPRNLFYLREADIHLDDADKVDSPMPLRGQQLAFRHHEVYTTFDTFKKFINNDPVEIHTIDDSEFDRASWLPGSSPKVQCDNDVVLSGHSFGACTVLSILSTKPLEGYPVIPVDRALILDPWLEPLPTPGPMPVAHKANGATVDQDAESVREALEDSLPSNGSATTTLRQIQHSRMMVINSETFTIWKEHFPRLQEIVARWEPEGGRIMTIVGSKHASFSDFFILPVVGKSSSRLILDRIMTLSLGYLDNNLDKALESVPQTKTEIEIIGVKKDGKPKRRLVGTVGDVIVQ